jgi:hypothetical protein
MRLAMRRWIVSGFLFALAACGREELATDSSSLHGTTPAPDLVCRGKGVDGTEKYRVLGFRTTHGSIYDQVVVEDISDASAPRTLGKFDQYVDTTPPPPTDIRFRGVYGGGDAKSYQVMLTDGGYTEQATVELKLDDKVEAWQTCLRQ